MYHPSVYIQVPQVHLWRLCGAVNRTWFVLLRYMRLLKLGSWWAIDKKYIHTNYYYSTQGLSIGSHGLAIYSHRLQICTHISNVGTDFTSIPTNNIEKNQRPYLLMLMALHVVDSWVTLWKRGDNHEWIVVCLLATQGLQAVTIVTSWQEYFFIDVVGLINYK